MKPIPFLLLTAGLCAVLPAGAVHRCVDAQGKTTFSDQMCPMGSDGGRVSSTSASGNGTKVAARTPPPPGVPDTAAGRLARLSTLDAAIASLTRKIDRDGIEHDKTMDRMNKEFSESARIAEKAQGQEASRASLAVSQNHIRSVQQSYSERLRGDHERLNLLKTEREQIRRVD